MATNQFMKLTGRAKDLTGQTFGRLTVLGPLKGEGGTIIWLCHCSCGTEKEFRGTNLKSGSTLSCGCWRREKHRTHGMKGTPEYNIWKSMTQRCKNPNDPGFHNYGGRGISVCKRWLKFENFIADMGKKPHPKLSIERRDNDLGYTPDNCYWASKKTQMNNKRTNHLITHNGETHTLSEWSEITGISYTTLRARRRRGWSASRALTQPLQLHLKEK